MSASQKENQQKQIEPPSVGTQRTSTERVVDAMFHRAVARVNEDAAKSMNADQARIAAERKKQQEEIEQRKQADFQRQKQLEEERRKEEADRQQQFELTKRREQEALRQRQEAEIKRLEAEHQRKEEERRRLIAEDERRRAAQPKSTTMNVNGKQTQVDLDVDGLVSLDMDKLADFLGGNKK